MAEQQPQLDTQQQLILEHRNSIHTYNEEIAQSVGLLREPSEVTKLDKQMETLKLKEEQKMDNLKPISLKEITQLDHVYKGRVLCVRNIEPPRGYMFNDFESLSVALLVQDDFNDVQRVFVYYYVWPNDDEDGESDDDDEDGESDEDDDEDDQEGIVPIDTDLKSKLGRGKEICIINPVLKMADDGKVAIVVNDPTLIDTSDSKDDQKKCAFCGKEGATMKCGRCKITDYCSKECQVVDWKHLKHKLVCKEKPGRFDMFNDRPPWGVYYLENVCFKNTIDELDIPESLEYGFINCIKNKESWNLLRLYQALIGYIQVDLVELHKACLEGKLKEFIIKNFETLPKENRGIYYRAFLKNTRIVKNMYSLP